MMFNTTRTPVTVFESTDPGAPVLASAEGALKTVLKACLVTGYGTKTALGWEALSESDFEITFRSRHEKATKCCLVVDNKTKKNKAQVSAFLTHADALANNGDTNRFGSYAYAYIRNSNENNRWWLIGNDRTFVFLSSAYNSIGMRFIYFGSFASAAAADNYNCVFMCSADDSISDGMSNGTPSPFSGSTGDYYSLFAKSHDGVAVAARAGTAAVGKQIDSSMRGIYPNVISGGFSVSEIYLVERSVSGGGIRGILGGIFWGYDQMGAIPDGSKFYNIDGTSDMWLKFEMDDSSGNQNNFSCLINGTAWEI